MPRVIESYEFHFPGRGYRFEFPFDAEVRGSPEAMEAALRAILGAMEPSVVELDDQGPELVDGEYDENDRDRGKTFHLVANHEPGGMYVRRSDTTTSVARIDVATLLGWHVRWQTRRARISIGAGWFLVDAAPGDQLCVLLSTTVPVTERDERAVLKHPYPYALVPPFRAVLDTGSQVLDIAVHCAAWTDEDGVGRRAFDRMLGEIEAAGWKRTEAPTADSLDWRSSVRPAPSARH